MDSTTTGKAAALSEQEGHTLRKLLCWPANQLFPALDIARMLALSEATADALAASAGSFEPGCSGVLSSVHDISCGVQRHQGYLLEAECCLVMCAVDSGLAA